MCLYVQAFSKDAFLTIDNKLNSTVGIYTHPDPVSISVVKMLYSYILLSDIMKGMKFDSILGPGICSSYYYYLTLLERLSTIN